MRRSPCGQLRTRWIPLNRIGGLPDAPDGRWVEYRVDATQAVVGDRMDVEHEYWIEESTGAIWAVELCDDVVLWCHGPIAPAEVDEDVLDVLDYSEVGVTWIEANRKRFSLYPTQIPFIPPT